ncbi:MULTISPECIES: PEP-utilizing enzyme [unclassified Leptolyngbya]|nr:MULTISPECIES: PEP-utilizing enzyme [unclassified Leptolyngbya]
MTRWGADVFPPAFKRGFREGTARYGLLLDYLEYGVVNGFAYNCAHVVGAPLEAKAPPPKLIFKLLTRLHPQVRQRIKASQAAFEQKLWRQDLKQWDETWKPELTRKYLELQSVDPKQLSLEDLITHLTACRDAVAEAIYFHHRLNPCALLPLGDFLVQTQAWTGLEAQTLLQLLQGATPVSIGAIAEIQHLAQAISQQPAAASILNSQQPAAEILHQLETMPGDVGEAAKAYLNTVGLRVLTGYDVGDLSALDTPELLVKTIRSALEHTVHESATEQLAEQTAKVRAAVPEEHRAAFDELLAEARLTYRIRDERGYLNDAWATGIARRAILAAGDRLVAAGKLDKPEHAVELTHDELVAMLNGQDGIPASELAEYFHYRTSKTIADAPVHLGAPPSPPPPDEWLPPAAARLSRAINLVLGHLFAAPGKQIEPQTIQGVAASPGQYEGIARLVLNLEDMAQVKEGDILVARMTAPSYNALLPMLGGIVTDRGGLLSHAAIVAREYGLPAVVGCMEATQAIPNGSRIRIDGTTGEVKILA